MAECIYSYQGVNGLDAISQHFGVPKGTLATRINQMGMTIEEAVTCEPQYGKQSKYEYQGVKGIKNIGNLVGIPYQTLHYRLSIGMTLEEAIAAGKQKMYPRKRNESGKRTEQARKQAIQEGIRHPYLLDGHWKLALGMRA
ncbi:hypothetical protein K6U40_14510 [Vibrio fluvialis]|uniref:hypothetical protein n=1 Tax=Vibrio fluvialis TaxID=676 RepID=UPI001EEB04AE|nr:hypothetical protein [Vibrio fluvialis]MCG6346695.1 hypothetical protein [Vibrio fluvialis]